VAKLPKLTHAIADQEIADIMAELRGGPVQGNKTVDGQKSLQRMLNRGAQNQTAPAGVGV
jgi:hypothetical protein